MTMSDGICECCLRKKDLIGVASSGLAPMSIAWCRECILISAEPLALVRTLVEIDGPEAAEALADQVVFYNGEYTHFKEVPLPSIDLIFHDALEAPVWPELSEDKIIHTQLENCKLVVLDSGMKSGQPSVALRFDLPDGRHIIAETSARVFCTAAKAIMGRYPKLFED